MKILPLNQNHIKDCINIANQQLGFGYFSKEEFIKENSISLVAIKDEKVVGFAYGYISSKKSFLKLIKQKSFNINSDKIGIIKTVAVNKNHLKQGIATNLIKELCDKIKEQTSIVASIAWQDKDNINIQGPLENSGFIKDIEIKNYWYQDSIKEGFICPTCGNPCHCSAILFILQ